MKQTKPQFVLTRINIDGTQEAPQIIPLKEAIQESKMNRRKFIATGLTASAAVIWLTGCEPEPEPNDPAAETPKSISVENDARCTDVFAHNNSVRAVAFNANGKYFYSISYDGVKIWSLPEGAFIKKLIDDDDIEMAVSSDGKWLITGGPSKINIRGLPDGILYETITDFKSSVRSLAISSDSRYLISGHDNGTNVDKTIYIWNLPDGKLHDSFCDRYIDALIFNPDGSAFYASFSNKISSWRFPKIKNTKSWNANQSSIRSLAITKDGKWLISGDDKNIKVHDLAKGIVTKVVKAHNDTVNALAITPDGRLLISGSDDESIKIWGLPDLDLKKIYHRNGRILALSISSDGRHFISGSADKTLKLWDLPDGTFDHCMIDLNSSYNTVSGLTYDVIDESGRTVTYTLPCGSTIPNGAKCNCNCVPGKVSCSCHTHVCSCQSYTSPCSCQNVGNCACFMVCTCNTVRV